MLHYASSLGLHGWPEAPNPALSASAHRRRGAFPAQFHALPCTSPGDHTAWLAHSQSVLHLLLAHHAAHADLQNVEESLGEHEREQDVHHVLSSGQMEEWTGSVKEWAQHLAAVMSPQREPRVAERNPQPSHRTLSAPHTQSSFTAAPIGVHPNLRTLLQPPVTGRGGGAFLHVEPEKQQRLLDGVEAMCRDVARWKGAGKRQREDRGGRDDQHATSAKAQAEDEQQLLSPPEALAWTSTLAAQQQPLVSRPNPPSSDRICPVNGCCCAMAWCSLVI